MNPFDLYGPEFLLFYLMLGGGVLLALAVTRYAGEPDDPPQVNLSDPYLIAYLRGGKNEALRIATVSLIDRGFLEVSGSKLNAASNRAPSTLRVPLERGLFSYFAVSKEAISVFKERTFDAEMGSYESQLTQLDLLPRGETSAARYRRFGIAAAVLVGIAAVKIAVALERGRSNIQFLIILTIVLLFAAFKVSRPRLTRRGDAMIEGLRTLFAGLKDRASMLLPGANASEVVLLAAVFGVGAVPVTVFPHAKTLYPKASSSDSSGSGCGSSCGSSCGGGGCGGGCGGCGS